MERRAVACYDLSGRTGFALYSPDEDAPIHRLVRLPTTTSEGSVGPAFELLFNHIAWANKHWPLMAIGYEQFLAPTGGKRDEDTPFVTSPATLLKQIGLIAVVQMAASMLEIPVLSIHNASWRKFWLGSQPRGTQRDRWKELAVLKARGLGWNVKGDDEADALGQLHFLLNKLGIQPGYARTLTQEMIRICYMHGLPPHV